VRGVGTVDELLARRGDRYKLRVQGDRTGFRDEMTRAGVTVIAESDDDLRVSVPGGWTTTEFFRLAERHSVLVRSLLRDDETLEELFLKSVS
jgi:ABC-2 type transport system ATP-binding protein